MVKIRDVGLGGMPPPMSMEEAARLWSELGLEGSPAYLGHNLYGYTITVTPEIAEEWLELRNENNRTKSPSQLIKLRVDVEDGDWCLTHQGIAFSAQGTLQDGQHRLETVVSTGTPLLMLMILNISDEARKRIDSHKPRTAAAVAKMAGMVDFDSDKGATINRMLLGMHEATSAYAMSTSAKLDAYELMREPVEWVAERSYGKTDGLHVRLSASVRGAIGRAWYACQLNPNHLTRLDEFCSIITTGRRRDGSMMREDDAGADKFRNLLLAGKGA